MTEDINQDGLPTGRPLTAEEFASAMAAKQRKQFATDPATAYVADQDARKKRLKNAAEPGEG